jgi:trans-2,3-dihydro-3-hydroxyanthranilate isomerase
MRARYVVADVFTDRPFAGNPLAVFPDGRGISDHTMAKIARELNLSETVFVLPAEQPGHARRLRIFTPGSELPFAGHPTIGTAHVLTALREVETHEGENRLVLQEGVGPIGVRVDVRDSRPVFVQLQAARLPEVGPAPPPADDLAQVVGLTVDDLAGAPVGLSCGVPLLFVPLRDRAALGRARVRIDRLAAVLSSWWTRELYLFTRDVETPGTDFRARMFAPSIGVVEDPATGSAAVALAGHLADQDPRADGVLRWAIEQGVEMGRPSVLELEAEKSGGRVVAVRVGGASVLVAEGTMEVSP